MTEAVRLLPACAWLLLSLFTPSSAYAQAVPDSEIVGAWQQVLENGDLQKLMDTYALMSALSDDENVIVPQRCSKQKKQIDAALQTNPVGLAIWYTAYRCADALRESAEAERRLRRFEALVRHAFASRPDDNNMTPLRVLAENDVWAFVEASGQELLHRHYDSFDSKRYLKLVISLWDEETKREQMLSFDFLDTIMKINHRDPLTRFPIYRTAVATAYLKKSAEVADSVGADGHALVTAIGLPTLPERMDALEKLGHKGSVISAVTMVMACERAPTKDCGERSIDALLPFVEMRFSLPMVILAGAYARGIIVPRNKQAARSLLDAADARLGGIKGRTLFATYAIRQPEFKNAWALVRKPLERAAKSGNSAASVLVAADAYDRRKGAELPKRIGEQLREAAENAMPHAELLHGLVLIQSGDNKGGFAWVEKAAQHNLTAAQQTLGLALIKGVELPKNVERGLYWIKEAGHGGDIDAMYEVAKHYAVLEDTLANRTLLQGWLQSAAMSGNSAASMDLAKLFETEAEGLEGNASNAAAIYRGLIQRSDLADKPLGLEARLRLAALLASGHGVKRDRDEAERLLKPDAENGYTVSQVDLSSLYLSSPDPAQRALGIDWLNKAVAAEDPDALDALAFLLWYGHFLPPDQDKAASLWQRLVDKKHLRAINNFAWVLCTSIDLDRRDGKRGLELLKEFGEDGMGWPAIDSIAACYAADGEFAKAIAAQKQAIDLATKRSVPAAAQEGLRQRLEKYEQQRIHIETTPPGVDQLNAVNDEEETESPKD